MLKINVLPLLFASFSVISQVQELTLKPGPEESKDAQVWSYDPTGTLDRGSDRADIEVYEWTKSGSPTTKYGLIDFTHLKCLPKGIKVVSATLKLYHNPDPYNGYVGHSQLSGSNEFYIERITSDWEESLSWNERPTTTDSNRVLVPASDSANQDYLIDVTALVQDQVDNPSTSFGMMLKIATEHNFRSVGFASGENTDEASRPELIIKYELNTVTNGAESCFEDTDIVVLSVKEDLELNIEEGILFQVFPNPSYEFVKINTELEGELEFKLVDVSGNVVLSQSVLKDSIIYLNEIPTGVYFGIIDNGKISLSTKLVKK